MGNQYYGRSFNALMELCGAEYRFYRNSLRNFRPANIGAGTGVADIAEYLTDGVTSPKQSICHNLPAMCIDDATSHFDFPAGLDAILADEEAFTIEYYGVPQDRGMEDYITLIGEGGGEPESISLRQDGRVLISMGAGSITSDQICWWWKDAILHFVVTKEAGTDDQSVETHAYVNGSEVSFASQLAGVGGFTDAAGKLLGWDAPDGSEHGFFGHAFLLRFYSTVVEKYEVLELYQDVQRLLPQHLHHIPIYQSA